MLMFIFLVSRTSITFQLSIDKKTIYTLRVTYENWGNPYWPCCRVVVAGLIEMFAFFELEA